MGMKACDHRIEVGTVARCVRKLQTDFTPAAYATTVPTGPMLVVAALMAAACGDDSGSRF